MLLGVIKMNFDVKDVKSWANRHDVKIGAEGYFCHDINKLINNENEYIKPVKSKLSAIRDNYATCFQIDNGRDGDNVFPFFLPLDAVKKDKPEKKYRPFKSMAEFTKVVYNYVPDYLNITGVGESFMVRRKCNQYLFNVLVTHLEYDENHNLISINGQSLKSLFENYEIITDDCKIIPFGVEVKND